VEHYGVKGEPICWFSFFSTAFISKRSRNQVKSLVEEQKHSNELQSTNDDNLVSGLNEDISPHERKHDFVFSANSV